MDAGEFFGATLLVIAAAGAAITISVGITVSIIKFVRKTWPNSILWRNLPMPNAKIWKD